MKRIVGHMDMDAFFASVEERYNPRFRGKPLVVGADPQGGHGRGVVSTANYKAREYGIHSAMPISAAWRFAETARQKGRPPVIFVGADFKKYGDVSARIFTLLRNYVPIVEEASVDEAYFEFLMPEGKSQKKESEAWERVREIALSIKRDIKEKEKLSCSIGIGPNKLIAKIASDMQKPDGLVLVREEEAEIFLEPLPIRKIPWIGPKTEASFTKQGVRCVRDLKKFSRDDFIKQMGKRGSELYDRIRGIDDSPVTEVYETKSIGEQETFMKDTLDLNFISERLSALCGSVILRFQKSNFKSYRTVALTIRFSDFETKSRAYTLPAGAHDLTTLRFEAMRLLIPFLDSRENKYKKPIRLLGVRIEKIM